MWLYFEYVVVPVNKNSSFVKLIRRAKKACFTSAEAAEEVFKMLDQDIEVEHESEWEWRWSWCEKYC